MLVTRLVLLTTKDWGVCQHRCSRSQNEENCGASCKRGCYIGQYFLQQFDLLLVLQCFCQLQGMLHCNAIVTQVAQNIVQCNTKFI